MILKVILLIPQHLSLGSGYFTRRARAYALYSGAMGSDFICGNLRFSPITTVGIALNTVGYGPKKKEKLASHIFTFFFV